MLARRLLLVAPAALLAACGGVRSGMGSAPVPADTTWYISIRARENGRAAHRLADSLEFGAVITYRYNGDDPLTDELPFRIIDSIAFTRAEFVSRIRARVLEANVDASTSPRFAVLYTHGFGTSLHEAWEHTTIARTRARSEQAWVAFCWPSSGSGVAWPSEGALFTSAYHQDAEFAAASRGAFVQAVETMREAAGSDALMLLSHSMGGQVVGEALASDSALKAKLQGDPLRTVAFVAPDVDASRFADSLVPALRSLTRRLLLYSSSRDRILGFARSINDTERAGLIAHENGAPLVRDGLESVDMSNGVRAVGWLRRLVGPRHTVTRATAALFDLIHIVGAGHPANCRALLGTARQTAAGAWQLTAVTMPKVTSASRCGSADQ